MCRVLGVSKGGFYNWLKRPPEASEQEDGQIAERIVDRYHQHKGRYGSPRIHQQWHDEGIHVGRKRVIRLMKREQLAAHHTIHRLLTTKADPAATPAENVLNRTFEAERPNEKWVTDVTYIATGAGWLYLAAVMDLYSRRIVGWAMAARQDEALVEQALALTHRRPPEGLLHHSDRGCQYTSHAYQAFLKHHGIRVSMSRKGNCWDNAVMERFFGTLKRECTARAHFATHEQARTALFEYREAYYNRVRKHSTLGYLSPVHLSYTIADPFTLMSRSKRDNNTLPFDAICIRVIGRRVNQIQLIWKFGQHAAHKQRPLRRVGMACQGFLLLTFCSFQR